MTYRYLGRGCVPADVDALAAPCGGGALRFAGEHASRDHLATAAGALASGVAEARRVAREFGLLPLLDDGDDAKAETPTPAARAKRRRAHDAAVSRRAFGAEETAATACALCGRKSGEDASAPGFVAGEFMAFEKRDGAAGVWWVHDGCAAASAEVRCVDDVWFNVDAACRRGRQIKCARCGARGATLGCLDDACRRSYHGRCAAVHQNWDFDRNAPRDFFPAPPPGREDDVSASSDSSDDEAAKSPFDAFTCLEHRPAHARPTPRLRPAHCTKVWSHRARPKPRPFGAPARPPPFDAAAPPASPPPPRGPPPAFGAPRHALFAAAGAAAGS